MVLLNDRQSKFSKSVMKEFSIQVLDKDGRILRNYVYHSPIALRKGPREGVQKAEIREVSPGIRIARTRKHLQLQ